MTASSMTRDLAFHLSRWCDECAAEQPIAHEHYRPPRRELTPAEERALDLLWQYGHECEDEDESRTLEPECARWGGR